MKPPDRGSSRQFNGKRREKGAGKAKEVAASTSPGSSKRVDFDLGDQQLRKSPEDQAARPPALREFPAAAGAIAPIARTASPLGGAAEIWSGSRRARGSRKGAGTEKSKG